MNNELQIYNADTSSIFRYSYSSAAERNRIFIIVVLIILLLADPPVVSQDCDDNIKRNLKLHRGLEFIWKFSNKWISNQTNLHLGFSLPTAPYTGRPAHALQNLLFPPSTARVLNLFSFQMELRHVSSLPPVPYSRCALHTLQTALVIPSTARKRNIF